MQTKKDISHHRQDMSFIAYSVTFYPNTGSNSSLILGSSFIS